MSSPAPVPETILKQRAAFSAKRAALKVKAEALATKRASRNTEVFQRAEKYANEYQATEESLLKLRQTAASTGGFFIEPEAKIAFVVRIRGINQIHPRVKKILRLLRLRQINNGVFVRLNKASLTMLRLVEPYIAWGYPTLENVRALIYKRGHLRVAGSRIAITSNDQIESVLSSTGAICIEDIVHEIYTCGKNFRTVNATLWPFKLRPARGGLRDKGTHFSEGGDAGNREHLINDLISRMI